MPRWALLLLVLIPAGCSDDGVESLPVTTSTVPSMTRTSTPSVSQGCYPHGNAFCPSDLNTTTTLPGRLGEAQVLFTELVRTYCDVAPNPLAATFAVDGDLVRVTDGDGNVLMLDIARRQVTPSDGADGIVPQPYRSCATHVFLGYADH